MKIKRDASRAILSRGSTMGRTGSRLRKKVLLAVAACLLATAAGVAAQDGGISDGGAGEASAAAEGTAEGLEEVPSVPGASETLPASPEGEPARVHIGVVPVIIHSVDLKAGTATISYYVWTRWSDTPDVDATTRIEIVNGSLETRESDEHYITEGVHHAYARCRATARVEVDYHAYPFDRHVLRIELEHLTLDETLLVFVVDEPSLRNIESPELSGWIVERPEFEVVSHSYHTNWGAPYVAVDEDAPYSRLRVGMTIRHDPIPAFAKAFLPLLISVLITALAFFVDPADTGARFSLGVSGTFGAVTSQVLVASSLPEIGYMTLSDKVHAVGLAFIFFVLLESAVAARLARTDRAARAAQVDRVSMVVSYTAFVGTFVALVATA